MFVDCGYFYVTSSWLFLGGLFEIGLVGLFFAILLLLLLLLLLLPCIVCFSWLDCRLVDCASWAFGLVVLNGCHWMVWFVLFGVVRLDTVPVSCCRYVRVTVPTRADVGLNTEGDWVREKGGGGFVV